MSAWRLFISLTKNTLDLRACGLPQKDADMGVDMAAAVRGVGRTAAGAAATATAAEDAELEDVAAAAAAEAGAAAAVYGLGLSQSANSRPR